MLDFSDHTRTFLSSHSGEESSLIHIINVDCSTTICEADVILTQPLNPKKAKYEFSLEVSDTRGAKTIVQSEIQPTKRTGAFIGYVSIVNCEAFYL